MIKSKRARQRDLWIIKCDPNAPIVPIAPISDARIMEFKYDFNNLLFVDVVIKPVLPVKFVQFKLEVSK